jgi:hypothetical protein
MDKRAFQIVGTVMLVAGLVACSIGAHGIATNLPVSDEQALSEAKRAVFAEKGATATRRGESLQGNVEFQVWKSALQATNKIRKEKRSEGSVFLVSGIIAVIWGVTMLYNSRTTPAAG